MSRKERDRLKVVSALAECRLKQVEASRLLRLSVRQVRRLLRRYREEGDVGLVHRSRGRPSNRRIPEATHRRVLALVRRHYADFGPTLASEKLAERDGIEVSREWLRQRMIEAHLQTVRRRRVRHHTWRQRRPCFGELVQMDTSQHAWFEGRAPAEPVLVTMIDDATSRVRMRFYPSATVSATMWTMLTARRRDSSSILGSHGENTPKVTPPGLAATSSLIRLALVTGILLYRGC